MSDGGRYACTLLGEAEGKIEETGGTSAGIHRVHVFLGTKLSVYRCCSMHRYLESPQTIRILLIYLFVYCCVCSVS